MYAGKHIERNFAIALALRQLKATIHLGNVAPTSGTNGDGYEIGAALSGGDHESSPDLTSTLGDEGLYVRIFQYSRLVPRYSFECIRSSVSISSSVAV